MSGMGAYDAAFLGQEGEEGHQHHQRRKPHSIFGPTYGLPFTIAEDSRVLLRADPT